MINVTKPFLPDQEIFQQYVSDIWKRNWLTNNGPLVNELELKLKEKLRLDHLLFLGNGTIALQIAIKALGLKREIITTPFSYVATTSSIVWEGCTPIFVDIDKSTCNIDPNKIESAITEDTEAILATHVYGIPCDVDLIQKIADKHNLKVIYDAAHCFGTKYKGESVLNFGDVSTISFHATKLFHTVEGGAVITKSPELLKDMAYKRNFGHDGPEKFAGIGINGKNSEFHAAMGLANLEHVDEIIEKRKRDSLVYDKYLMNNANILIARPKISKGVSYNYAYYPVIFENEEKLLQIKKTLENNLIYPRRYFYPILSQLSYVTSPKLPIAESISKRVLCLPMYFDISNEEIEMICRFILRASNYEKQN